jgi:hypothetical protein
MLVPKRFELYAATSYIFGQYGDPKEFIAGTNYLSLEHTKYSAEHPVNQSGSISSKPVSSTFGFYNRQATGRIFSIGVTSLY